MPQGRCSATLATAKVFLLLLLLSESSTGSSAKTYKVGDEEGWRFGVQDWPKGKCFKDGDVLEFNYPQGRHNVVVLDEDGYKSCKVPDGAKKFATGNDRIVLKKGKSFFICGFPTHCDNGMKLEILVE